MGAAALNGKPQRVIAVPPIYRAIMLEIERRRLAVGISMDRMSELMGAAERSYAKMLYPDTPSGRMAQWNTLQSALDVLFCDGYDLRLNTLPLPCIDRPRIIRAHSVCLAFMVIGDARARTCASRAHAAACVGIADG